jgi:hypothetical protein
MGLAQHIKPHLAALPKGPPNEKVCVCLSVFPSGSILCLTVSPCRCLLVVVWDRTREAKNSCNLVVNRRPLRRWPAIHTHTQTHLSMYINKYTTYIKVDIWKEGILSLRPLSVCLYGVSA